MSGIYTVTFFGTDKAGRGCAHVVTATMGSLERAELSAVALWLDIGLPKMRAIVRSPDGAVSRIFGVC